MYVEELEPKEREDVPTDWYDDLHDKYDDLYKWAVDSNQEMSDLIEIIFEQVDRTDIDPKILEKVLRPIINHIKERKIEDRVSKGVRYEAD